MKRRQAPSQAGLQQLEGLPLRLIALKLSNPGPLAASCSAAHRSINSGGDFDLEWFLHWVHALAPLRPWQFAAVGWQRLGGAHATAEQLFSFIARVCTVKHQQQQVLQQHAADATQPGADQQQEAQAQQRQQQPGQLGQPHQQQAAQQQAAQQQPGVLTTKPAGPPRQRYSPMPHNLPLPSLVRKAHKLLAKGDPIRAMAALCPGSLWLLLPHAAAAGNARLLQQLISAPSSFALATFPCHGLMPSHGGARTINVAQMSAYAAMQGGHTPVLVLLLASGGASIRSKHYQLGQLFRYAVRHSNAACVQLLLDFAPCIEWDGTPKLTPWPQHLAMAAARVDPWAAEVVALLLRTTPRKLLAAKFMPPVFKAACRTGHMPVLTQLLQLVADAPKAYLPHLFKAAAAAGNFSTWQLLFVKQPQPQQQQQQQQQQPQRPQQPPSSSAHDAAGAPALAAARSGGSAAAASNATGSSSSSNGAGRTGGLLSLFGRWFSPVPTPPDGPPALLQPAQQQAALAGSSSQQQQQPRSPMLPTQPPPPPQRQRQEGDTESSALPLPFDLGLLTPAAFLSAILAAVSGMCPSRLARSSGQEAVLLAADADRAAIADSAWELAGHQQGLVRHGIRNHCRQDFCPWASFGGLQALLSLGTPLHLVWLLQHDMVLLPPGDWQPSPAAAEGLQQSICFCLRFGRRQEAGALWQLAKRLGVRLAADTVAQRCLDNAIRAAAAGHDTCGLWQQVLFAQYSRALVDFTGTSVRGLAGNVLPTDGLLFALASAWNAAVLLDAQGLPQQVGVPLQQHLRLCVAAALPPLLEHIPGASSGDVTELLLLATGGAEYVLRGPALRRRGGAQAKGEGPSQAAGEQEQEQGDVMWAWLDQVVTAVVALQGSVAAAGEGGGQLDAVTLLSCMLQLAAVWQSWVAGGPLKLLVPNRGSLTLLDLEAAASWPEYRKAGDDACTERLRQFSKTRGIKVAPRADLCKLLPASALTGTPAAATAPGAAGALAAAGTAAAAAAPARAKVGPPGSSSNHKAAAAAAAGGSSSWKAPDAHTTVQSAYVVMQAVVKYIQQHQQNLQAAANKAVSPAETPEGRLQVAAAQHMQGHTAALQPAAPAPAPPAAAAAAADSRSCGGGGGGVLPLWQQAVLALPVTLATTKMRPDADVALEAALQPCIPGAATPVFLAPTTSSSSSAGGATEGEALGAPTAAAAATACPAAPPEHELLRFVLRDSGWMQHSWCYWYGCMHRPDAVAWVLHPQQEHLWLRLTQRHLLSMFLAGVTHGVLAPYRWHERPLVEAHEQQLRQHRAWLAAGVTAADVSSSSEGGGVLPRFAAGAADAASVLLAVAKPVYGNRLVRGLAGSSSAAHVEHVKAMLAAMLSAPTGQLQGVVGEGDWLQVDVDAVRKAGDVGDRDLMTLLMMLDSRAWALQPSSDWMGWAVGP